MTSPFYPTVGNAPLLTRNDVARVLGLTAAAVRKWELLGKLTPDRIMTRGTSLFEWASLAAILREAIGSGHASEFLARGRPGIRTRPHNAKHKKSVPPTRPLKISCHAP